MEGIETLTTILHVIGCTFLIIVVLLQSGKGGGMGSAFGGGGGGAVFGGRGAGNVLTRITTVLAVLFMATSMILSWISSQERSVLRSLQEQQRQEAPQAEPGLGGDANNAAPQDDETSAPETPQSTPESPAPEAPTDGPVGEVPPSDGQPGAAPAQEPGDAADE